MARPLTPERWRTTEEILLAAWSVPREQRDSLLLERCGQNTALLSDLRNLIAAQEAADSWVPPQARDVSPESARRAGPFELERMIGRGGMGAVYMAHRADGQYEQKVAVKLIALPFEIEPFRDRFRRERQILAGLNHPNITRLLDGGETSDGAPYLVMEYVDGHPVDQDCDARRLTVTERIRLFLHICEAVDYAHRNLVVHCDLKPSNILVTSEGVAKLLDFGTARFHQTTTDAAPTIPLMTPRYSSPEQLRAGPAHVSTDVYSLGIVLYELLTGAWPFGDPSSQTVLERLTRDVGPTPPQLTVTATAAESRSMSLSALQKQLSGDLASILTMTLEHDPARRYSSVRDFAADLERYLAHKPVLARRRTLAYSAQRFLRRNVWYVAAGAVVILAMVTATVVSIAYGRAAVREAERSRKISHFTTETLLATVPGRNSPLYGHPEAITLESLLDNAGHRAGRDLAFDPAAEAEMRTTLGAVWMNMGKYDKALIELNRASEMARRVKDQPFDNQRALLFEMFCDVESELGDYPKAREYCQEAMASIRKANPPDHDLACAVPHDLAFMNAKMDAPPHEVEEGYRASADAAERYFSASDVRRLTAMMRVATCRYDAGDLKQAEVILEPIVVRFRGLPGPAPDLFPVLRALGILRRTQGRLGKAQALFQEALDLLHKRPAAYFSADAIELELLLTRALNGEAADVAPRSRELLHTLINGVPAGHLDRARPEYLAGSIFSLANLHDEADPLLRDAARIFESKVPHWPGLRAEALLALAESLAGEDKNTEAPAVAKEALHLFQSAYGANAAQHPNVLKAQYQTRP